MQDKELVLRCRAGQKECFDELVKRYQMCIYTYVISMIDDRIEAEDITQETFLRAYLHLNRCQKPESFSNWLFGIARNCSLEHIRKKRPSAGILTQILRAQPTDQDRKASLLNILQDILQGLQEDLRTVILMKFQQEMSCAEIAEALGRPQGTIRRWLSEAYEILGTAIQKECKRREL